MATTTCACYGWLGFFIDPVLLILLFATFVFSGILLFVSLHTPADGQTFQVFSGLATGFAGAVLARVKPHDKREAEPPVKPG